MRNLAELDFIYEGEVVRRAPPSPGVIAAFEREFNVSLPSEYLELLRHANGGEPELWLIKPMGRTDIAEWMVNRFFYLDEDREGIEGLWWQTKTWQSIMGEKQVPIAYDQGGNPTILDFTAKPPKVVGCLVDEGFDIVEIAASFADFIDRLEGNRDRDCS